MTLERLTSEDLQAAARLLEALPRNCHIDKDGGGRYYMRSALYAYGGDNAFEVVTAFVRDMEAMEEERAR